MTRAKPIRSVSQPDFSYQAGGPVAAMHHGIEVKMAAGLSHLPEWTAYADASSPTDQLAHYISRAFGILALVAGVAATINILF